MKPMTSEGENADELWRAVLDDVESRVSDGNFKAWFKPSQIVDISGDNIVLQVNNFFTKTQFEQKFDGLLKEILIGLGKSNPQLQYVIKSKRAARRDNETVQLGQIKPEQPTKNPHSTGLNPRYRFDNFIVGTCNDLAHAAAHAAAAMPGEKYNPIFIYGGSGLGKTHLIQAIGNEVLAKFPDKKVLYATAEKFGNEFIDYVRFKKDRNFAGRYRGVDVLIVDDIQFIAGKKSTQEEFFNTFNDLHQANKQIVLSADRPPSDIPDLADRLKTRFQMGMTVDVSLPDYETRCAIINSKAEISGAKLPIATTEYLAENIRTNVRELEGALNQLLAYCEMRAVEPTVEIASGLMGDIQNKRMKRLTPRQIIEKTAKFFELKPADLISPARDHHIALPRHICVYLLRSELHMSRPNIGKALGGRDNSTIIHSERLVAREIKLNADLRSRVNNLKEELYV
jgi:chromosomal replication initiator protein